MTTVAAESLIILWYVRNRGDDFSDDYGEWETFDGTLKEAMNTSSLRIGIGIMGVTPRRSFGMDGFTN
jgi:hypothetical protein